MNTQAPLSAIATEMEPVSGSTRMRVGVLAAVVCAALGCQAKPEAPVPDVRVPSSDETVLLTLDCYSPVYQVDENGRVIRLMLSWQHLPAPVVAEIGKLTELRSIDLAFSTINDEGLAQLKDLQQLKNLGLGGTFITDKGLAHLEKLPSLQWVWLPKQSVTQERVDRLKEVRPDMNVYMQ